MTALDEKALEKAMRNTCGDGCYYPHCGCENPKTITHAIRAYLTALPQSPVGEIITGLNLFQKIEIGDDLSQTAPLCNGSVRDMLGVMREAATALLALQAENERLTNARENYWRDAEKQRLRAERAESKAEGFVMVPVEPTPEMIRAWKNLADRRLIAAFKNHEGGASGAIADAVRENWKAMIAAAPSDKVVAVQSLGKTEK